VTLPEELHELVRDVVADLESAAGGLGPDRDPPPPRAPRRERRRTAQAAIVRLPGAEQPAASSPTGRVAADAGGPAPAGLATSAAARPHAFLARVRVASSAPRAPLPAHTRRVQVACRRASPLDATRASRMLRVAVPSTPVSATAPASLPAWLLTLAPPSPAPPAPVPLPDVPPADTPSVVLPGHGAATGPAATPQILAPAGQTTAIALPLHEATPALGLETARRPPWRNALGHVTNLAIAAALGLVGIFCCIVVGLVATGHHLEEVVTGSMQPTIPIGSLVVTEQLPAGQLQVGDVLVFPNPNDTKLTIVHRIVWLSHDQSGDVLVRTKGDYNALPDQWTIKRQSAATADRVIYIVPGAGTVAGYLQTIGFWGLIALMVALIGYYGTRKVRQILAEESGDRTPAGVPELIP